MPKSRTAFCLSAILLTFLSGAGCHRGSPPTQLRQDKLLWVFPGVGQGELGVRRATTAFRDAGYEGEIRVHDWAWPLSHLYNLTAQQQNREDARHIARQLAARLRSQPDLVIDLVGYSGGGGVALMVVESLPDRSSVRNVILVQPAISPDYDLEPALRRITGKLVHYQSRVDWLVLGVGTSLAGTIDREFGPSSGFAGLELEKAVSDVHLRRKVVELSWSTQDITTGHIGAHFSAFGYGFNRKRIAAFLVDHDRPDVGGRAAE